MEVARLLAEIDVESASSENEIRVFGLKYALSTELQPILQSAISGTAAPTAQGGQGNQGGGANPAAGQVTPPSSNLTIISKDGKTGSGILAGVIVTSNPSINSLLVRAPTKSMPLIATLIAELDRPPNTESQLKVFPIKNGDATAMTLIVQQLFGLAATAGSSTSGGIFGGNQGGNQFNQGGQAGQGAAVGSSLTICSSSH